MFDIILIVLLVKIRGNFKEAGETGASRYIVPTIVFWALAILLVLIGRSDENLTLMVLGLLCYVPAFVFSIAGHKKSKNLFLEQAINGKAPKPADPAAGGPHRPGGARLQRDFGRAQTGRGGPAGGPHPHPAAVVAGLF